MTRNKPFEFHTAETNPEVVIRTEKRGQYCYDTGTIKGEFRRVSPDCIREVHLLQMLEMHHEKFAPAKGNGVLISLSAFEKLTA